MGWSSREGVIWSALWCRSVVMTDCIVCCRNMHPLVLDQHYINLKNQVIKAERRLLKETGFCVHVKHPHKVDSLFGLVQTAALLYMYSVSKEMP